MKTMYGNFLILPFFRFYSIAIFSFLFLLNNNSAAQCPANIDFEKGDFSGWECYIGTIEQNTGIIRLLLSAPTYNRHEIQSSFPGDGNDYWGGFPKNCPNGSNHSIRLGNESTGRGAESISYTFTIPAGQNNFSLVYNYAVVLQDRGHPPNQQPRLSIEVLNITDNKIDSCSSFDFVINGNLPGFKTSPHEQDSTPVRYKDWSAAFINLEGNAGKTFKISFTTTDCSQSGHFGYAYIDLSTGCSSTPLGSVFCPDDNFVNLIAPPGFQSYKWFNTTNTTLGTAQNLYLDPLPRAGDTLYVEFTPYNGYGCVDTLTAYLSDTLTVKADAGPDREFCANPSIRLGAISKPGEIYTWSPAIGLSDPQISNPVASPFASTQYTLTVTNTGGGCKSTDVVNLVKKCDVIEIYVPGAFTPDGNGTNDRLRPVLYGFSKVNYFRVYNRLGHLLYAANSDTPGWDGAIKGKPAGTQTVVWMIEAVDAYGRIEKRQGTSILIR
jgi:gliding motility-associated-like protein